MQASWLSLLNRLSQRNDILLAIMLVAVVFMMILPLPTGLVDVLIAFNMGISVVLLMIAVYIRSPLEFSAFPSVLLLTTLFRLALSITTTRLILLQADAGQIVYTFGNFVVGGNLVVGIVVFLIITIVQFLVITKGSERVAEVSARFSLDAMPGKQMSIDGDMRAGVIDVNEAKERRALIEKESQLYGAMDGAMKFVKGDAIAGLVIIIVNILGGVTIGVMQRGLPAGEALQVYSILTVGDGLISQIPALFISITAGMIVTRVTTEKATNLGADIGSQVGNQPKALLIGGGLLLAFAFIPGFPTFTFICLAVVIGGGGWLLNGLMKAEDTVELTEKHAVPGMPANKANESAPVAAKQLAEQETVALTVPVLIDLASDLQTLVNLDQVKQQLATIRRSLYLDLGVPFPGIQVRVVDNLEPGSYAIYLQEIPVAKGLWQQGQILYTGPFEQLALFGLTADNPINFLPGASACWVAEEYAAEFDQADLSYLQLDQLVSYHLSLVLKKHAEEFIGIQETRYLLAEMEKGFAELVKEVQRLLPIQKISEVLQRLVSEEISIRDVRKVLEALAEWGQKEKDVVQLTEYVRSSLKRYISHKFSNGHQFLPCYMLDQYVEDTIRGGIRQTSAGCYLALDPAVTDNLLTSIKRQVGDIETAAKKPVLIVAMDIRRYVRKIIEAELYALPVLSFQELTEEINVQPLGRIVL
ncbi:type III secretion system export apparatus subunit SctV [Spartinivicinus poritis]|uniref:Type III secretion system export apparatus subunit SctV n=1 Tax=Spartinivicinus poritis TaxID=2994640 RepID=A0ABT5U691_9GAMM|nr:type III secretion system export apparatus subunit SctV [Spartinivicinus sp. A2-2]MDE1460978.1 type III secretion system export apparatus subunit SctV [Spartinivicinus sp. A2-2]